MLFLSLTRVICGFLRSKKLVKLFKDLERILAWSITMTDDATQGERFWKSKSSRIT